MQVGEYEYMDAYIIGNIIGRLFVSYMIVWVVIFVIFTSLDWKMAFIKSIRWPGLLSVSVLFLLGIAGAVTKGGGL